MSENIILKVKNLTVELEREKVIEDLSFNLKEKEILVILISTLIFLISLIFKKI